ncbi:MAG: 1-acyl-sn-glycerol-3-phosphate acyltransferase, partial [Pseudomonadota bacterium]
MIPGIDAGDHGIHSACRRHITLDGIVRPAGGPGLIAMKDTSTHNTVLPFLSDGRFRHLKGVLDQPPPWLMEKIIPFLSANVVIEDQVVEQIRNLAKIGPVVYAMKYKSWYDLHFLRMRFARLGLPLPAYVFDMPPARSGSLSKVVRVWKQRILGLFRGRRRTEVVTEDCLKSILENAGAAVMFLVDDENLRDRYVHPDHDPLGILMSIQGKLAGCISIVPLFLLFDRTPRRAIRPFRHVFLGDPDKPGILRRMHYRSRRWTPPELIAGEPVHLLSQFEEFGAEHSVEDAPHDLRSQLNKAVNDRIRVNRGPENVTRSEIKERVLMDRLVQDQVIRVAEKEGKPVEKVRRKAESYVEEIAADPRLQMIHFWYYSLGWTFNHVFDGIDLKQQQFDELKRLGSKGTLVFVPCHKSHFDYLLTGWLMFVKGMAVPLIAAGNNLLFWPVGQLMRYTTAFFLRRSFKGLDLYAQVFAAYLRVLLQESWNIKVFIEGGRSRTGQLLQPKLGMLSFLVQAVDEGETEDLTFIPVFLGYDENPEEGSYLRELSGKEKTKESFLEVLRARKVLSRKYGKVFVRFHDPISYKDFRRNWSEKASASGDTSSPDLVKALAYRVMTGIVRAGVV